MNFRKILFFIFLFSAFSMFSQQGDGGIPKSSKILLNFKNIDHQIFQTPNILELKSEDAITDNTGIAPWRFGFNNYTSLNLHNSGSWIDLSNGDRIWLLKVTSKEALTINLTFSNTDIPNGNELYIYDPNQSFVLGKFTSKHLYDGQLGAEIIPGQTAIVEYLVKAKNNLGNIEISTVTHGYRTASEFYEKAFGSSGSCNMNVNCNDGIPWQNQRNSAVMLVSGSNGFCSGALINNTQNDGKPYVLTANHCYSNPASWIFRFNWQSPDCNNPGSSPSFVSLSGATLRAKRQPSDMCLVEITGGLQNGTVPLSYNPYFSGYNNSNTPATTAVSIHHPSGDIKKISFDDDPVSAVQAMGSSEANSSWQVNWDRNTTTEGGSSGSPLFDQNKRIIGQLWGGGASCSNLSAPDYYGSLNKSWNPSGSNSSDQLKHWLDPNNDGVSFIDGFDPSGSGSTVNDASLTDPQGVVGTFCGGDITPMVKISNTGTQTLTSATITYDYGGPSNTYNWTGSLAQWQSETVTLPTVNLANGTYSFNASVDNPNASVDENPNNNNVTSSFTVVTNGQLVAMELTLDCYASETSWTLEDPQGLVLFSGSGYQDNTPGVVVNEDFCLNYGCYKYKIKDTYGDGLAGAQWNGCNQDGSVFITYNNDTLAEITPSNADFGDSLTLDFCVVENSQVLENSLSFIKTYPNPASNYINVLSDSKTIDAIKVVDMLGKMVFEKNKVNQNSFMLNVRYLKKGAYLIKVFLEGGNEVYTRFIKN
ncbi:MAG: trypsin-like peptidase domain-containing protein [Crocinitomicaceae bacterium]|nr:trypsin-like peptidase domain-containing protein [Crocinitomicaceae bacterium]